MSWPLVAIKEVAKVVTGKTPSTVDDQNFGGDIPFVTPAELGLETYVTSAPRTLSAKGASTIKLVPKNAVMVCCIGSLGKMAIAGTPVATNQQINSVIFDENRVDAKYGFYALQLLKPKMETMAPSTTVAIVNKGNFEAMQIPLPPLPEQKRIAAILDKADAIRRKRQQAIQLADDFLRAAFLDMFGDPVTNPKGWEVRPLSDLVSKLGDGLHGTPEYDESGDYYFINGNNLDSGSVVVSDRVRRVGDEEFKRHKKELTKNTMLVSINGTIGKVAFYQGERVVLGKSVCYFNVIPERISSMYLYHLIGSHYFLRYTGGIETGSTIKNVSLKSMREFPVPVPSANLQSRFEVLVKRIESKKSKLFAGHNSAGALFDSLSQNAFSGQL